MIGKILLASVVAVPVATTATVAATGVAWIDVKEGGRDGHRIVLPVPLLLAETAASFIPEKELDLKLPPEALAHLGAAREVLQELAASPDGEYVRVEEQDERVLIEKKGDTLRIQVHGHDGEDVTVNVPLSAVGEVFDRHGRISPSKAVGLLRHARFSTLVEVTHGEDHVKITVF
ncbi:MAG TPA: hypothetical protein VMV21_11590 [Vicinamibacteria bacterium]|nr:hypothetical protein [Vicinamibacteria bacterium]